MAKNIEERIEKAEKAIELLQNKSNSVEDKSNWIADISGSFKDDVEFDEILRLGREERVNDQVGGME